MQKRLDKHDKPLIVAIVEPRVAPAGSGMLSTDHLLPSHRSASSPSVPPEAPPTATQALLDVHETASSAPCDAPVGKPGKGSSDQPNPFQRSARGISTGISFMADGS